MLCSVYQPMPALAGLHVVPSHPLHHCAPTVHYRHHNLHLHAINPHVASAFEGHAHLSAGSGWLVRRQEAPLLHGRQGSLQ